MSSCIISQYIIRLIILIIKYDFGKKTTEDKRFGEWKDG